MRLFVGQNLRSAIGEDQGQFVGEPLAIMNYLGIAVFLFPVIDELYGTPECDMPLFVLSEDAVEQTSSAQQSDMASMQRSYRPAANVGLLMNQDTPELAIGR